MRRIALTAVLLFASSMLSSSAKADELEDFGAAQRAYEQGDYTRAMGLFEAMVGGATPTIRNEVLITESRKYLAAAYLFEGRESDAEAQFTRLIEDNPDYILDPVAFPAAVHTTFSAVKERVRQAIAERTAAQEAAERQRRERELRRLREQQERITRLEALAREVRVEERPSRWIAMLPFGTGQLQNGHRSAGLALMGAQIFLATTSITTFIYHRFLLGEAETLRNNDEPVDSRLRNLETGVRVTNQVATALLGAVAIGGIIDAQLRFRGERIETRERELPEDLQGLEPGGLEEDDAEATTVGFSVGLGYAELRLDF